MDVEGYRKFLYVYVVVNAIIEIIMLICAVSGNLGAADLAATLLIGSIIFSFVLIFLFGNLQDVHRICKNCGTKASSKFCPKCGKPMDGSDSQKRDDKVCLKCGQQLRGESFCPGCGTKTN